MDQETGNAPEATPAASEGVQTPLSDIFGRHEPAVQQTAPEGQPEPQAAPQPEPEKGEEQKAEQPRDERGKFAPKPPVAPPATKEEEGRIAAVKAEREKRQALERELAELRARLVAPPAPVQPVQQAPQQPPAQPQAPLSDLMFSDPEKFVAALQQRQEEQLLATRIATSEAMARQQPDYDAAEQALTAYAQSGPAAQAEVARMLRSHPAPAMWAYQAGKHLLAQQRWQPIMQQHADPEAYLAAEVERRMQERLAEQPVQHPAPRLPTSLANARAAAPRTGPGWAGPTPLSNVFGRG